MPAATRSIPQDEPAAPGRAEDQLAPFSEPPSQRADAPKPVEIGGPKGLEPTRYGDWERNGRCSDF